MSLTMPRACSPFPLSLPPPFVNATPLHNRQGLDELKAMVEGRQITPTIDRSFGLNDSALAFNYSAGPGGGGVGDHIGKISITFS
jgi:hypothetical protein